MLPVSGISLHNLSHVEEIHACERSYGNYKQDENKMFPIVSWFCLWNQFSWTSAGAGVLWGFLNPTSGPSAKCNMCAYDRRHDGAGRLTVTVPFVYPSPGPFLPVLTFTECTVPGCCALSGPETASALMQVAPVLRHWLCVWPCPVYRSWRSSSITGLAHTFSDSRGHLLPTPPPASGNHSSFLPLYILLFQKHCVNGTIVGLQQQAVCVNLCGLAPSLCVTLL